QPHNSPPIPSTFAATRTDPLSFPTRRSSDLSRSATLTVTDNASNSPQTAGVSGTGTMFPSLSPSPVPDFGNQNLGSTSAAQAVTDWKSTRLKSSNISIAYTVTNLRDYGQTNN